MPMSYRTTFPTRVITASILALATIAGYSFSALAAETEVGGSQSPAAQKYFSEGTGKSSDGNYVGAVIDLTHAVDCDPKFGKAYANRASARFNLHDYQGTIEDLNVAQKYFPDMPYLKDLKEKARNAQSQEAVNAAAPQEAAPQNRAAQVLLPTMLGGDFSDPATIILMNAQRRGLMNGGAQSSVQPPQPVTQDGPSPFH